ncbi:MAG TPA: TlpA disulfide reductase family protein [Parasegetibacter sp.]
MIAKTWIGLFFFGLKSMTGVAQTPTYSVRSNIENMTDSVISLTIWDGTSATRNKTIRAVNGQINFTDTTSIPLMIRAHLSDKRMYKYAKNGYYPVKSQQIWFVVQPGSKVQLNGKLSDFAEVYPSGDKENELLASLTRKYFPLLNRSVNIMVKLNTDSTITEEEKTQLTALKAKIDDSAMAVLRSSVRANISSLMGMWFTNDMLMRRQVELNEVAGWLTKVDRKYHPTNFYQVLDARVKAAEYAEGKKIFTISSPNTPDGKTFSTASLKGKFYLIDFWGSWCGPCMAGMPGLKALKAKYPAHLEIVGIAKDSENAWRKEIERSQLNWIHILNGNQEFDFVARLNVAGFPTKILVDPEGTILYRVVGEDKASAEKISRFIDEWIAKNK